MSKTSGSYMVCRYFTVDSLRLWFRHIFLFVTDNYSGIHCRRLGLASIAFFGCSARDWDGKDYLRIIPRVVW